MKRCFPALTEYILMQLCSEKAEIHWTQCVVQNVLSSAWPEFVFSCKISADVTFQASLMSDQKISAIVIERGETAAHVVLELKKWIDHREWTPPSPSSGSNSVVWELWLVKLVFPKESFSSATKAAAVTRNERALVWVDSFGPRDAPRTPPP